MIQRSLVLAATLAALSFAGNSAHAAFILGTQGFADIGTPTINSADINTATTFTFGDLVTTSSRTESFLSLAAGTPIADTTLTLSGTGGGFTLSNPLFGTFSATSVVELPSTSTSTRAFEVSGVFTGGTAFGTPSSPLPAQAAISMTQVGGPGGAISASLTLSAVPEPASVAMLGLGLGGVGLAAARRRLAAK